MSLVIEVELLLKFLFEFLFLAFLCFSSCVVSEKKSKIVMTQKLEEFAGPNENFMHATFALRDVVAE